MKSKIILPIFLAVSLFTGSLPAACEKGGETTDIPTWFVGDTWVYDTDIYVQSPNGSFDGTLENLTFSVAGLATYNGYDVYVVNISGTIDGYITYSIVSGDVSGQIYGEMFTKRSDLAAADASVTANGVIDGLIFDYPFSLDAVVANHPPLELYDFPMPVNESWGFQYKTTIAGTFVLSGLYNETFNTTEQGTGALTCPGVTITTVPAGLFDTFLLQDMSGNRTFQYAPAAKNVIQSATSATGNITYTLFMNMTQYLLTTPPFDVSLELAPAAVIAGENVTASGRVTSPAFDTPVPNVTVLVSLPHLNMTWPSLTDVNGNYSVVMTAPFFNDTTPTIGDVGSEGVVATVTGSNITTYVVTTLSMQGKSHFLTLFPGWNLVTFPIQNTLTAQDLFSLISNLSVVYAYNASAGTAVIVTAASPPELDFPLKPGTGYFLAVSSNDAFTGVGNPVASPVIHLYPGWNMLGWCKETPTTAKSILENITDCTVLYWYDAEAGTPRIVTAASPPETDYPVACGMGLFAAVTSESDWQGEG
jgi:hypothetical protein